MVLFPDSPAPGGRGDSRKLVQNGPKLEGQHSSSNAADRRPTWQPTKTKDKSLQ